MRNATSGNALPHATYTWLIAAQNIGAGANLSPAAIPCNGAHLGDMVIATARTRLPQQAAGAAPQLQGWVTSEGNVGLVVSNSGNAALVATAADIIIDLMVIPINP